MARKDAVERDKRRRAARAVIQSSAMDDLPLGDDMKKMLYAVADGKMTSEEAREAISQKYRNQ